MPQSRLFILAAACAALVSCAQDTPPPVASAPPMAQPVPPPPAPSPAAAPTVPRYDGRYSGTATRISARSAQCTARTLPTTMTVSGGRATLNAGSGRAAPLEGVVAADGSLPLASATTRGGGRIARNRFTGQARGGDCAYRIALGKTR